MKASESLTPATGLWRLYPSGGSEKKTGERRVSGPPPRRGCFFRAWEARFWHAREGGVLDWGAYGNLRMMIDVLGYPGAQRYWQDRGHWFSEEFRVEVDAILENAEPTMLRSYGMDV